MLLPSLDLALNGVFSASLPSIRRRSTTKIKGEMPKRATVRSRLPRPPKPPKPFKPKCIRKGCPSKVKKGKR